MEKFTNGPWLLDDRFDDRVFCDDCTGSVVAVTGGKEFSLISRTAGEINSNAHLIAAAPEMYAILSQIVRWQDSDGGELREYMNNSNIHFANVLAKARGEK